MSYVSILGIIEKSLIKQDSSSSNFLKWFSVLSLNIPYVLFNLLHESRDNILLEGDNICLFELSNASYLILVVDDLNVLNFSIIG